MNKNISVNIYQGNNSLEYSDINVVIDVIRAFTVSHHAFLNKAKEIILTNSEEEALFLKKNNELVILAGEVKGFKIDSFDFGNSPYDMTINDIKEKILVQKTTNGVKVALNSLDTDNLFVTGYSNAFTTSKHILKLIQQIEKQNIKINIIASHPSGDDDLACALYMKKLILNDFKSLKSLEEETVYRIVNSEAAHKFYDIGNEDFSILDISLCCVKKHSDFVMKATKENNQIKVKKYCSFN